jgi:hypothetical protein
MDKTEQIQNYQEKDSRKDNAGSKEANVLSSFHQNQTDAKPRNEDRYPFENWKALCLNHPTHRQKVKS